MTCPDIACILGGGDGCINTAETDENGCTRCVCKPFPGFLIVDKASEKMSENKFKLTIQKIIFL